MTKNEPVFQMVSLDYNVTVFKNEGPSSHQVSGFALDMGLPVKICVRHEADIWYADEFETGFAIRAGGFPSLDLPEFLSKLYELIVFKVESGAYAKAIAKAKAFTTNALG